MTTLSLPCLRSWPGTYALILASSTFADVRIGKLGRLGVKPGFYVYIGSAFGPGGLKTRLAHHSQVSARPHWHVDYLRTHTSLQGVWCTYDSTRREHQWAEAMARLPGASVPLLGFGSSDCTCVSHLCFFAAVPEPESFQRVLRLHRQECEHFVACSVVDQAAWTLK
ncbi:MAG: DUF123 domain-containing protein [bacterium]